MQHASQNPHSPYTQDHENWSADLERQQRRAREEQDANDRQLAEQRHNQEQQRRQAQRDRQTRSQNNQNRSKAASAAKQAPRGKPTKAAAGEPSGIAKLIGIIGAITGAVWAYKQQDVRAGEEINWLLVIGAGAISGTLALKLYQVILAVLAIAVIGVGINIAQAT